jgi:hypothetical protein
VNSYTQERQPERVLHDHVEQHDASSRCSRRARGRGANGPNMRRRTAGWPARRNISRGCPGTTP